MNKWRLIVALAAILCGPTTVLAQVLLPSGLIGSLTGSATVIIPPLAPPQPGLAVSDSAVEANTFDIATSLTMVSNGALYAPEGEFFSGLDQALFSGIDSHNDTTLLPVTDALPCDSYTPMHDDIAPALMRTYEGAIANTQALVTELEAEDFTPISLNIQAPYELVATQGIGQALLAIVQELQLLRAQEAAHTMVDATDHLHQLDSVMRSLIPRDQSGGC